jgi:predicted RNA-binding Zn-ribbon protein involved in translation (DUF1610 family)
MRSARNMRENETYTIDLCEIRGNGEFRCPKCGTSISPDDLSENTYTIIQTRVKEDRLQKILLQCNKCGSKLQLIGFETSKNLD